jgi:hypothetical protein
MNEKLLNALLNGEVLTSAQIRARYGITNPSSVINTLRADGYAIYCNYAKNLSNKSVGRYRLGTPSREMVSLAHAAGVFSR